MSPDSTIELMHLVLDGEATPEQAQQLELLVANEAAIREQFAALQQLFAVLDAAAEVAPPGGMLERILAKPESQAPSRRTAARERPPRIRQPVSKLFWRPRVFVAELMSTRRKSPGVMASQHRTNRPFSTTGEFNMSEQKPSFISSPKGKVAVGAGAVAAIVIAVSVGMDFPKGGTDTSGTIAPAQRYRAPQNTAQDINVTTPSAQQAQQTAAGIADTSGAAAGRAAGSASGAAQSSIEAASGDAAGRASGAAAGNAAGAAAGSAAGSAKAAIESSAGDAAGRASGAAAGAAAGKAAGAASGSAKAAIESSAGDAAGRASGAAAGAAAGNAAGKASGAAAGAAAGAAKAAVESAAGDAAGRAAGNAAAAASGRSQ